VLGHDCTGCTEKTKGPMGMVRTQHEGVKKQKKRTQARGGGKRGGQKARRSEVGLGCEDV